MSRWFGCFRVLRHSAVTPSATLSGLGHRNGTGGNRLRVDRPICGRFCLLFGGICRYIIEGAGKGVARPIATLSSCGIWSSMRTGAGESGEPTRDIRKGPGQRGDDATGRAAQDI